MTNGSTIGEDDPLGGRLLAAAVDEFAARGYAGARVAEIARRAGVTTGAIYSRYRGKAELLAEAIEWATDDEFDRLFTDHRFAGRMEDILRIAGQHLIVRRRLRRTARPPTGCSSSRSPPPVTSPTSPACSAPTCSTGTTGWPGSSIRPRRPGHRPQHRHDGPGDLLLRPRPRVPLLLEVVDLPVPTVGRGTR